MRLAQEKAKRSTEENIIPLINIVFLLLIFFLLAGTLASKPPFDLEPVAAVQTPNVDVPEGALFISGSGAMYYEGRVVKPDELQGAVQLARTGKGEEPLEILMDRRLTGEKLFPVIETLGRAGITKVRLLTEPRK
jgi:biopolymer transport protein ExbD